ncbi:hypothetical protein RHSIM_Rhsim09G0193600 [Rhododendron simsii]|uniref:Trichome birefringence-like N-terminal domain-containing protein n=1 Tax=Rhododendron simsii TaxID=118357 RepID=A0A834GEE6_RHOSS|nr:hypothetical protein RHSIM_Rhsim09G0193600 [Rhododendron simsii]
MQRRNRRNGIKPVACFLLILAAGPKRIYLILVAMTLASPKGASTMVAYPRTIVSIATSVCGLASFLIIASFLLVSHPFESTVRGYFYPIDNSRKFNSLDWSNKTTDSFNDVNKELGKWDIMGLGFTENAVNPRKDGNRIDDTSRKSESTTLGDRQSETVDGSRDEMDRNQTSESQGTKDISNLEGGTMSSPDPLTLSDKKESVDQHGQEATGNSTPSTVITRVENATTPSPGFLNNSKSSNTIQTGLTPSSLSTAPSDTSQTDSGCDLFHGKWVYDSTGPLYTNNSCPVLTQMQNCQGNGRPDKEYENWRWKPSKCDLPRFDAKKFLELMRGKTLAFIGDSVARNQMESLFGKKMEGGNRFRHGLSAFVWWIGLWESDVETPKNRGNRRMQRYYFRSTSTMIVRIWSSWLVHQTSDSFDYIPKNVVRLHLDAPDEGFMEFIPQYDVLVLSSGHWFAKQSVYILNNEIVGGQLWWPDKSRPMKVNNVDAFGISVETILNAIATHPKFTGLTIVRSFSPDHYEGGAWNTGGSCTGKVKPALDHEIVENGFTNIMLEKQVAGFDRAIKKVSNGAKLKFMDITGMFGYRHDGHPGPYRSPDPNKVTKRGPGGKPPPQDCLHWCMPGPVDTWNELVLEIIRREFEGS